MRSITTLQTLSQNPKIRKAAKIRNRYNQEPDLTQDTTWKSDNKTSQT